MPRLKMIVAVIAVLLMVVLGLQNTQTVEATMLFFTTNVSLAAVLLLSFGIGVVAGLLIALGLSSRRKSKASAG